MKNSGKDAQLPVAMYISSFAPQPMGGMEIQGLRLAQQLGENGIRVTIFTHGFKGCRRKDVYENIEIVRMYSWLNWLYDLVLQLKGRLRKTKPAQDSVRKVKQGEIPYDIKDTGIKINGGFADLIFYFIQLMNMLWLFGKRRNRFRLLHVHGVPWVSFVASVTGSFYRIPVVVKESTTVGMKKFDDILFGKGMRRYILKRAHFVAISNWIFRAMQNNYNVPLRQLHYIPNGVSIQNQISPEPAGIVNVLFVGNLTQGAAKGLDVLLQAWQLVIKKHPEARLLIAGNKKNEEDWIAYFQTLGIQDHVTLLGDHHPMKEVYSMTTAFVSPSRREGLSNALLEAMAWGLACVVTNISGSQDMITDNESGFVVEPDDATQLAEALTRLLSSAELRLEMRKRSYAKVKETCSFDAVTGSYMQLYASLLNITLNENAAA